jgi:hypothetical protein
MRSRITATVVGAAILIGGYAATQGGGGAEASGNLFLVASGGTPSCVRSSSLLTYQEAVNAGGTAICGAGNGNVGFVATAFDNACDAATGGDIVAVRNGAYSQNMANGFLMEANEDCSNGTGADYNPNWEEQGSGEGSLTNWVTFVPGESPQNITFEPASFIFGRGNYHMIWKDIDVNTGMKFNYGGESSGQRAKNIIIRGNSKDDRANIHGIQIIGAENILLKHLDYGPSNQCGKANDANVPDNFECDENAATFESQYAFKGTASPGCSEDAAVLCGGYFWNGGSEWVEMYIHNGGAGDYLNVRVEDVINHDQQGKRDGTDVHPGCLLTWDFGQATTTAHNLVLDHYVCVRSTGASIQLADSGVTVQNSMFGCQVQSLENTGGTWDGTCTGSAFGLAQKTGSNSQTNILFRYNVFTHAAGSTGLNIQSGGSFDTFSNTRFVGNIFLGSISGCSTSGVSFDSNTFAQGVTTCGTNAESLGAGDPVVDSSYDTDGSYVLDGDPFDPNLDGSPSVQTVNPTGDLSLDHDFEGDARSNPTHVGADH